MWAAGWTVLFQVSVSRLRISDLVVWFHLHVARAECAKCQRTDKSALLYIRKALQQWWKDLGATAILDALGKRLDLVVGIALFSHLFADFAIRINDGGVVFAAELFTNLGKG